MQNILIAQNPGDLNDKLYIKVSDFGLSIIKQGSSYEDMLHDFCGTLVYMAPEIITTHSYSQQCDVWAIGVIMYALLTGRYPFFAAKEQDLVRMICNEEPSASGLSSNSGEIHLITKMLTKNPALRITAAEVILHPWISGKSTMNGSESLGNVLDMMRLWRSEMLPRLGPKPFTPPKLNETETFDKVFSVPQVPCNKTQNGTYEMKKPNAEDKNVISVTDSQEPELLIDRDFTPIICKDDPNTHCNLADEDSSSSNYPEKAQSTAERRKLFESQQLQEAELENSTTKVDDCSEDTANDLIYKPRTPTTAERRKIFETNCSTNENEPEDNLDITDQTGNFERASSQRNSVAERRKIYESRPLSVQDSPNTNSEKTGNSPVLLRRKCSFKSHKDDNFCYFL